jgi:transposase
MHMRDELGTLYEDADFAPLFPAVGQPAETPWRLALVLVMQFMEDLTDRQAAHAVRGRIDWKYALCLPLEDSGFDFSVLSEFRTRLGVDPSCGADLSSVPEFVKGMVEKSGANDSHAQRPWA